MPSDKQLVERVVVTKDRRAFSHLVKRHQSSVRYSLRQWTGWDESLADDLSQETFIKAYRSIHTFRFDAAFSSWLYQIAYRLFLDHVKRADTRYLDYSESADINALSDKSITMASVAGLRQAGDEQDLHRDLAKAMLVLSPDQRAALHLYLHRQCSHQDIAGIMSIPLGTVKTHIQRGRQKLAEQLVDWHGDSL